MRERENWLCIHFFTTLLLILLFLRLNITLLSCSLIPAHCHHHHEHQKHRVVEHILVPQKESEKKIQTNRLRPSPSPSTLCHLILGFFSLAHLRSLTFSFFILFFISFSTPFASHTHSYNPPNNSNGAKPNRNTFYSPMDTA